MILSMSITNFSLEKISNKMLWNIKYLQASLALIVARPVLMVARTFVLMPNIELGPHFYIRPQKPSSTNLWCFPQFHLANKFRLAHTGDEKKSRVWCETRAINFPTPQLRDPWNFVWVFHAFFFDAQQVKDDNDDEETTTWRICLREENSQGKTHTSTW